MPDVTAVSFYTGKQQGGTVSYEMKICDVIPMYIPGITPRDAYNVLTYSSLVPSVVRIKTNSDGSLSLEGLAAGNSVITAKSHNNISHSFEIHVLPELTNVQVPASHTMAVNTYWTVAPLTLTPSNGLKNYVLTSSNTDVLRVEENSKVYAIRPGTAQIRAEIGGAVKSSCNVTVSAPAASGNPSLKYYNVKYEASGKATLSLGIVPMSGAAGYYVVEHTAYKDTMAQLFDAGNVKRTWTITSLFKIGAYFSIDLRCFSIIINFHMLTLSVWIN